MYFHNFSFQPKTVPKEAGYCGRFSRTKEIERKPKHPQHPATYSSSGEQFLRFCQVFSIETKNCVYIHSKYRISIKLETFQSFPSGGVFLFHILGTGP
jgi:hypothetical protein